MFKTLIRFKNMAVRILKTFLVKTTFYHDDSDGESDDSEYDGGACEYCGYGRSFIRIIERLNNSGLYKKFKIRYFTSCATYSSVYEERSYTDDDDNNNDVNVDNFIKISDEPLIYLSKAVKYSKTKQDQYIESVNEIRMQPKEKESDSDSE